MIENLCQLFIWQGINIQNIYRTQNIKRQKKITKLINGLMSSIHSSQRSTNASLAINKMQIKMALRFYLILFRMVIIKETNHNKCWGGCWGKWTLHTVGGNVNKHGHYGNLYASKN
jgi:hypothetical protein